MTLRQRVAEATELLGSIDGVNGLILAGSIVGAEAWPLSDVDIVLVYADEAQGAAAVELQRRRERLEDFWSWCGVSGALDLGGLWFAESEARAVVAGGPGALADRAGEHRWFAATERAYQGRVLLAREPATVELAAFFTTARFAPEVTDVRVRAWAVTARAALDAGDLVAAAEAMIDWATERWGGRCASLGERWTAFEHFAARRGRTELAAGVLAGRGAGAQDVAERVAAAPWWLRRRIDAAFAARQASGQEVTVAENARDQLLAFTQLWARRGLPPQPWTQPVPSRLVDPVAELRALLAA